MPASARAYSRSIAILGPATCSNGTLSLQRELTTNIASRWLRRVEDHARRHPRHEHESAHRRAAGARVRHCCSACRIRTSASSRVLVARRSDDHASRSCSSRIRSTRPSASTATTSAPRTITASTRKARAAVLARPLLFGSIHASRLVDDASSVFDASILTGPVANYPGRGQLQSALERDYSTGDIPHVFVGACGAGQVPPRRRQSRCSVTGCTLQSGVPLAVTQVTNFNAFAGFGTQRPNLGGDPDPAATSAHRPAGSTRARYDRAAVHARQQLAQSRRGPAYRNLDLAIVRRTRCGRQHVARSARRSVQPAEHAAAWGPQRGS